jgi:phosphoribosylanthranilate isomerase
VGTITTRIKITGVTTPDDADMAAAHGVDMVACVLNPSSPRYVTSERVWEIRRALRGRALLVGVFADVPDLIVQRLMDHCQFDAAQLFEHLEDRIEG